MSSRISSRFRNLLGCPAVVSVHGGEDSLVEPAFHGIRGEPHRALVRLRLLPLRLVQHVLPEPGTLGLADADPEPRVVAMPEHRFDALETAVSAARAARPE